jgi:hypothetical protein
LERGHRLREGALFDAVRVDTERTERELDSVDALLDGRIDEEGHGKARA